MKPSLESFDLKLTWECSNALQSPLVILSSHYSATALFSTLFLLVSRLLTMSIAFQKSSGVS